MQLQLMSKLLFVFKEETLLEKIFPQAAPLQASLYIQ